MLDLSLSALQPSDAVLGPLGDARTSACSYRVLRGLGDSHVETAHGTITGRGWSGHSRNQKHGLGKQRLPPMESLEIKKEKGEADVILWLLGTGWPLRIAEQMCT